MFDMKNNQLLKVMFSAAVAAVLWIIIFIVKPLNFWFSMCIGVLLLIFLAILFRNDRRKIVLPRPREILIGIIAAVVLYVVFYIGNYLSAFIIPSKDVQISSVYMNKNGTNHLFIFLSLLFVIGPGEEIFWRGFVQRVLSERFGAKSIIIASFLYAAVHIATGNFMLIMAALICGLFWGSLYYHEKKIYPVIISHAIWDVAVFLLLPFK